MRCKKIDMFFKKNGTLAEENISNSYLNIKKLQKKNETTIPNLRDTYTLFMHTDYHRERKCHFIHINKIYREPRVGIHY